MRTVSIRLADLDRGSIPVGFAGENQHTQVRIDCKKAYEEYPTAVVSLIVKNPHGDAYPAVTIRDGDIVSWNVTNSDLAYDGTGEIQLTFTVGEVVKKSYVGRIRIEKSILSNGEAPDPIKTWIDEANEILDEVEDAIPAGGTTGQVLAKKSDSDRDTEWVDQTGGGGTSDYDELENRPQIAGVTLTGDVSLHDLGAAAESDIPDVSGFYTKPSGGIPDTDLASGVQTSLGKADSAYQKPSGGIPSSDMASAVQTSLGKADSAYQKPVSGIPAADIEEGVIPDPASIIDDTAGSGDTGKAWSADKVYGELDTVKSEISQIQNVLVSEEWQDVTIEKTSGKYYKPDGTYSTYSYASHSQPISVSPGDLLKVSAKTENNLPGIMYFNSDTPGTSSVVGYDCYTPGSTVTYTDQQVTVPTGASYAVLQGNTKNANNPFALKKYVTSSVLDDLGSRMTSAETSITNDQAYEKYMSDVMCDRMMALGKTGGFSYSTFPKFILSIRVDDLRADVDKIAKIITSEYSFPVMLAACKKELNKSCTGITDPSEKIATTRLGVCQWVQEHGGEIILHPDSTVTSADYATSVKPLFLDARRTFVDNGLKIRGAAVANTTPDATLKAGLDPYMYGYFDYSDGYGSSAPYSGMSVKMIGEFSNSVSDFQMWLDARIAGSPPVWRTLVMHQLDDDVTETALRGMLDYITTKVTNEDMVVMLWSAVYDTYGTH